MRVFFVIIILFFLSACVSQKERAESFLKKNPQFLAEQCALNFPPFLKYIKGETTYDTIKIPMPGIVIPCPETTDEKGNKYTPTVKCPDYNIEKIIASRIDIIEKEHTDKLFLLQSKIATLSTEAVRLNELNKKLEKQNQTKNIIIGLMAAGILVFITYRVFRK